MSVSENTLRLCVMLLGGWLWALIVGHGGRWQQAGATLAVLVLARLLLRR